MKIFYRVFGIFWDSKITNEISRFESKIWEKTNLKKCWKIATEELRTNEDTIQNINNKKIKKELELFDSILKKYYEYYNDILISKIDFKIDVYSSLASFLKEKYIKPEITDSRNLIVLARHPIVEKLTIL